MARSVIDLRKTLESDRMAFDIVQKIPCTKEENEEYHQYVVKGQPLPPNVYAVVMEDGRPSNTAFYKLYETDLSKEEMEEYLKLRKLRFLKTIRNCVVALTALVYISVIFVILCNI